MLIVRLSQYRCLNDLKLPIMRGLSIPKLSPEKENCNDLSIIVTYEYYAA